MMLPGVGIMQALPPKESAAEQIIYRALVWFLNYCVLHLALTFVWLTAARPEPKQVVGSLPADLLYLHNQWPINTNRYKQIVNF
jgi:hypothetical protein